MYPPREGGGVCGSGRVVVSVVYDFEVRWVCGVGIGQIKTFALMSLAVIGESGSGPLKLHLFKGLTS
jgi:hypothetical protein